MRARCDWCGMEVEVLASGLCLLGHPVKLKVPDPEPEVLDVPSSPPPNPFAELDASRKRRVRRPFLRERSQEGPEHPIAPTPEVVPGPSAIPSAAPPRRAPVAGEVTAVAKDAVATIPRDANPWAPVEPFGPSGPVPAAAAPAPPAQETTIRPANLAPASPSPSKGAPATERLALDGTTDTRAAPKRRWLRERLRAPQPIVPPMVPAPDVQPIVPAPPTRTGSLDTPARVIDPVSPGKRARTLAEALAGRKSEPIAPEALVPTDLMPSPEAAPPKIEPPMPEPPQTESPKTGTPKPKAPAKRARTRVREPAGGLSLEQVLTSHARSVPEAPPASSAPPAPSAPSAGHAPSRARTRTPRQRPPRAAVPVPPADAPPADVFVRTSRPGPASPRSGVAWILAISAVAVAAVALLVFNPASSNQPGTGSTPITSIALTRVPGYLVRADHENESRLRGELSNKPRPPQRISAATVHDTQGNLVASYQGFVYKEPVPIPQYLEDFTGGAAMAPDAFAFRPLGSRRVWSGLLPRTGQAVIVFDGNQVVVVITADTGPNGDAVADAILDARGL